MMKTPPSVTLRVKRKNVRQIRRNLSLSRHSGQNTQGVVWSIQSNQGDLYFTKVPQSTVVQRQEMAAYFRLFEDDLIKDFLRLDGCYKLTDKYLLAMTFVYFKRACFTITEYTRKNFFIALYLANTMEEDEEESKYEIFPWALGKNWKKRFPRFLEQRDKLWARIEYRAAVSRRCCEEVMAIVSSHFVWQRQRSDHHGGAQRQYNDGDRVRFPRGPYASPVSCSLCKRDTRIGHSSSLQRTLIYSARMYTDKALQLRFKLIPNYRFPSFFLGNDSSCKSTSNTFMDWINE
uniref:Speedy/RINGO cell cycle regulator family member A n=1 Tax=Oreochromis aureus TaxID=47969 RepID=A0A668VSZ6_OREAU